MSKQISLKIFADILEIVKRFPNGASLPDIVENLSTSLSIRSIQRYLAILVQENRLSVSGKTRSTLYYIPSNKMVSLEKKTQLGIPLSKEALEIESIVRKPSYLRNPVGYNRNFISNYHPNQTYYLSEEVRKHLAEIGKSPDGARPAGTYAKHMFNRLLIDLSWNSSRLEGNTYSLLETQRLIEIGKASEGKDSAETQMILNHKAAIEFMIESAEHIKFDSFTILNLHALLSDNLLSDPMACGNLRSAPVGKQKSSYHPLEIPQLIREHFEQMLSIANAIEDAFEQAFFIMVQLPYLQPFLDVNKRVSRLAANIPLIRENLCPLSFIDVPQELYISALLGVYELNRIELLREVFIWAYERSSALYSVTRQQLGEPDVFRLRNRDVIISTVKEVVRGCRNKQTAVDLIKQNALAFQAESDRERFLQVVETELLSLHKGNIARFKLRLAEYELWLKTWY